MSITVLEPGPLTTVQDAGRIGYAAQGYRSCGAVDATPTGWAMHSWAIRRVRRCWNAPCGA